jgi:hypothetical protein
MATIILILAVVAIGLVRTVVYAALIVGSDVDDQMEEEE